MAKTKFKSASLKLERAKEHIEQLNSEISTFMAQKPMKLVVRHNLNTDECTLAVKKKLPVPDRFSLLIGDAVHNLRSSLDHLIYEIVYPFVKDHGSLGIVQFPFTRNEESLKGEIIKRKIDLAGEEVVRKVYSLRPYRENGEPFLYGLNPLDNADKHRLIVAVGTVAPIDVDAINADFSTNMRNGTLAFYDIDGETLMRKKIEWENIADKLSIIHTQGTNFEKEAAYQPNFQICFARHGPEHFSEVVTSLITAAKKVGDAIDTFR